MCWSSYSEWQAAPRDRMFCKPTFSQRISSIPKLFMRSTAKTIRCAAIQEIRVMALPACEADKPGEQSPRAGRSGSGSKGSLFGLTKICSPNQAPPACITKDQNKQAQVCVVARASLMELFVVFRIVAGVFCCGAFKLFQRRARCQWVQQTDPALPWLHPNGRGGAG